MIYMIILFVTHPPHFVAHTLHLSLPLSPSLIPKISPCAIGLSERSKPLLDRWARVLFFLCRFFPARRNTPILTCRASTLPFLKIFGVYGSGGDFLALWRSACAATDLGTVSQVHVHAQTRRGFGLSYQTI